MVLGGIFGSSFEEFYSSPDVVLVAFLLLIFVFVFEILGKRRLFSKQRGINVIVSMIVAVLSVYYMRGIIEWLRVLNIAIVLVSLAVLFLIFMSFVKMFVKTH